MISPPPTSTQSSCPASSAARSGLQDPRGSAGSPPSHRMGWRYPYGENIRRVDSGSRSESSRRAIRGKTTSPKFSRSNVPHTPTRQGVHPRGLCAPASTVRDSLGDDEVVNTGGGVDGHRRLGQLDDHRRGRVVEPDAQFPPARRDDEGRALVL